MEKVEQFMQLLEIKRYAYSTRKTYQSALEKFFTKFDKSIGQITQQEVQEYLYQRIREEKISFSTQPSIFTFTQEEGSVSRVAKSLYSK